MTIHLFRCQFRVVSVCWTSHPAFALIFGLLQQVLKEPFEVCMIRAFLVLLLHIHIHFLILSLPQLVQRGHHQLGLHVGVPRLGHHLLWDLRDEREDILQQNSQWLTVIMMKKRINNKTKVIKCIISAKA